MSLINEALKKAQSQRTQTGPTTPPNGPPSSGAGPGPVSAGAPDPSKKTALLIAGAAVIVSLSVVTTVFLLRENPRPMAAPLAIEPAAQRLPLTPGTVHPLANTTQDDSRSASSTHAISPAASPVNPPANGTLLAIKNSSPGAGASPSAASDATLASHTPLPNLTAAPAPTSIPVPAFVLPEPTPVKVTIRIQILVDKFRISGIRLSDTDSKVILNDHLFHVGDSVETSLGLKVTKIEEHRLTFVDGDGNVYLKRF